MVGLWWFWFLIFLGGWGDGEGFVGFFLLIWLMDFFFYYFLNSFTGFASLLLCIVVGINSPCTWLRCFSAESLAMLQLWRFSESGFVVFSVVSPKSLFSIQMFYPDRLRSFQEVSKFICESCKIVLWKSGLTWTCHICCARADQWSWWAWCSLSLYCMNTHLCLRNCS